MLTAKLRVGGSPRWCGRLQRWQQPGEEVDVEAPTFDELLVEVAPYVRHCDVVDGPANLVETLRAPEGEGGPAVGVGFSMLKDIVRGQAKATKPQRSAAEDWAEPFCCPFDDRVFTVARGLAIHLKNAHAKELPEGLADNEEALLAYAESLSRTENQRLKEVAQAQQEAQKAAQEPPVAVTGAELTQQPPKPAKPDPRKLDEIHAHYLGLIRAGLSKAQAITDTAEHFEVQKMEVVAVFRNLVNMGLLYKSNNRWMAKDAPRS